MRVVITRLLPRRPLRRTVCACSVIGLLASVAGTLAAQSVVRLPTRAPMAAPPFAVAHQPYLRHEQGPIHGAFNLADPARAIVPHPSVDSALEEVSRKQAHRDYTWEGVAVGAAILGTLGFIGGYGLCHDLRESSTDSCTRTTISFGIMGTGIGAVLGGFIGSTIPKNSGASTSAPGP